MFDFRKRIENAQEKLKKENLDAIILLTNEGNSKNIYYLSGFGGTTGVLVVSQTDIALAVDGRYTLRAKEETKGCHIVNAEAADRRVANFTNYIKPALAALSLGESARLGFEADRISVSMADAWKQSIKNLIQTNFFIETLRQVKDDEEIKYLKKANDITSTVFEKCIEYVQEGITEVDIAKKFDIALRESGAIMNSFDTIIASGPNSAIPHHETSERVLRAGEPVVIDFGGLFPGGYCSDITRTVFVPGKIPDQKLIEIYKIVLDANIAARDALYSGMMWKEYDSIARDYITERGYGEFFTHGLGHSLGLEAHDPYNYADCPLEAGTVITDEPGIYIPGVGGVRIEDDLVITENGAHSLTTVPYLNL